MSDEDWVCVVDGVHAGMARSGKLVHLDDLPEDVESHDVEKVVTRATWNYVSVQKNNLAVVAAEMLVHHTGIHPASDCEFAKRLEAALRSPMTIG